jgi:DNA-directed RNA polymerase subunit M/transcription elongation factor TFIIS
MTCPKDNVERYLMYYIKDPKQVETIINGLDLNDPDIMDKIFEYGPLKGICNKVLWDLPIFERYKKIEMGAEEGVIQCGKCKGYKVYSYNKQTRSGDEALTTFAFCSTCSSKWRIGS